MLKSQDIVTLCARLAHPNEAITYAALAAQIGISSSETHASVERLIHSGLLAEANRRPRPGACAEFLVHGLRYSFPARVGRWARGLSTAVSAAPLAGSFVGPRQVWAWEEGQDEGESIEPLYPSVPQACAKDPLLWQWLALLDAMRIGAVRERKAAQTEIEARLLGQPA